MDVTRVSWGWSLNVPFLWSSWSSGLLRLFAHDNASEWSLLAETLEGTLRGTPQVMQEVVLSGTPFAHRPPRRNFMYESQYDKMDLFRNMSLVNQNKSGSCRCICMMSHVGHRILWWRQLIVTWVLQCRVSCRDSTSCPWISTEAEFLLEAWVTLVLSYLLGCCSVGSHEETALLDLENWRCRVTPRRQGSPSVELLINCAVSLLFNLGAAQQSLPNVNQDPLRKLFPTAFYWCHKNMVVLAWNYTVGTLPQGCIHNVPLPRVPQRQSTTTRSQVYTIPDYYEVPYVVPTYTTPPSIVESAAYAFSPAWHAIAINT